MTGRLRLGAQVIAVGVVAALLGLLVWKVAKGTVTTSRRSTAAACRLRLRSRSSGSTATASSSSPRCGARPSSSTSGPRGARRAARRRRCSRRLAALADKNVVFVGVNVKDFRGDRRFGSVRLYPTVYDGKGSTVGRYGSTGFPETYFVDARGRVVHRIAGRSASRRAGQGHRAGARAPRMRRFLALWPSGLSRPRHRRGRARSGRPPRSSSPGRSAPSARRRSTPRTLRSRCA